MIETPRLTLRKFRATDIDDSLAYRDDREFARFLPHIPQPFTRADAEKFVEVNMTEPWDTLPTFAVVLDGHVIGTVNFEISGTRAMIGYAIARAYWGRGIATEAARAAIAWLRREHAITELWARTQPDNIGSRRVMEKLGMTLAEEGEQVVYRSHFSAASS